MKTPCLPQHLLLCALLFTATCFAAEATSTLEILRREELSARGKTESALTALRAAERAEAANVPDLRRSLAEAEAAYRRLVSARLITEAGESPRPVDFTARSRELVARNARTRDAAAANLAARLPDFGLMSGQEKAEFMAQTEATLRTQRLEAEVVGEAARRQTPLVRAGANDARGRTQVNTTTDRLDELVLRIATTDTTEQPNGRSAAQQEAEMWLRDREREMNLQEYQRLARHAQIVSADTGQPITGVQRDQIARDAEKNLAEAVSYHARNKRWFDGTTADTRADLGRRLQAEVADSAEYRALDYLAPSEKSTQSYYRALANSIRRGQADMESAYARDYLGQKDERGEGFAKAWWSTGFGTLARANDLTGDTSLAHVTARMNTMREESDAAATALLNAAAEITRAEKARTPPDLSRLPARDRELLSAYGYIAEGPDKQPRFALPSGKRAIGDVTRADLPGASWLDALSMETVAVTAASVALPELAGARAAAYLTKAGYSARAIAAGNFAASTAVNVGFDVATQYAKTGTVDPSVTLIDNLLVGGVAGKLGNMAGEAVTGAAGRLAKNTALARALKEGGSGSAIVRETEALIRNAIGVTSESALQTAYQAWAERTPGLTYEDFLANAASGALGRVMSGTSKVVKDEKVPFTRRTSARAFDDAVARFVPEGMLRDILVSDTPARAEEKARTAALAEGNRAAWERFMKATENGKSVDKDTLRRAMERGDFSWPELKIVAADAPGGLPDSPDPTGKNPQLSLAELHRQLAGEREKFYAEVDTRARVRAKQDLDLETAAKLRDLERRGLPADQAAAERKRITADYDAELADINAKESRLGSAAAGSDIDRSWKSDRVRRAAKEVEEAMLYRRDQNRPGPSTARTWDLNEYYDVMPFIKETYEKKIDLSGEPGARVSRKDVTLTHGETMSAGSLAAAMSKLDANQRAVFERNKLAEATSPEQRRKLEAQFEWARQSLDESQAAIDQRAADIAKRTGKRADDPDVALTARDEIYGERTRELQAIERKIKALPDNSPEGRKLRAEWEQKMTVALREGIETYSQTAGLDLICNTMQGEVKKNPDGTVKMGKDGKPETYKAAELINDPTFNINGRLKGKYTPAQLDAMVNDQGMFLMEHLNGYRHGHESAETAARAIGKYGERALLALSAKGDKIAALPDGHPLKELLKTSNELAANKDSPAKLREILERMGDGDADRGLRKVMQQVEALPGLQGLNEAHAHNDPKSAALAANFARREWASRRAEARELGGAARELEVAREEQAAVAEEKARLAARQAEQDRLDGKFLRKDQPAAARLRSEVADLEERLHHLPGGAENTTATAQDLRRQIAERKAKLGELEKNYVAAGSPKNQDDAADRIRKARLGALTEQEKELAATCGTMEVLAEEERTKRELDAAAPAAAPPLDPAAPGPASTTAATPENSAAPAPDPGLSTRPEDGLPLPNLPRTARPQANTTDWGGPQEAGGADFKMRISQSRFRIGQKLPVSFQMSQDEKFTPPTVGLYNHLGMRVGSVSLRRNMANATLDVPVTPGNFELRAVGEKDAVLARLPVPVLVTPAPGALSLPGGNIQPLGAKLRLQINAPASFYHKGPWVGLWSVHRSGGLQPQRLTYWNTMTLATGVEITLPGDAGDYELRLFDRDDPSRYVLDVLGVRVVPRAAPGALKVAKREFTIGEPIELSVDVPEGIHLERWARVAVYDLTKEGRLTSEQSPEWWHSDITQRKTVVKLDPTAREGLWEARLFDRVGNGHLLASVRFATRARPARGALKVESPTVHVGGAINVQFDVPENVYLNNYAYISLHALDSGAARGELAPRLSREYLGSGARRGALTFTAPELPYTCELRLYDREGDGILLDSITVQVLGRDRPGLLKLSKPSVAPGEKFTASVTLPPGVVLYNYSNVSVYHVPRPGFDPPASGLSAIARTYLDLKSRTAELIAPTRPGRYEARLYDRDGQNFIRLDRAPFEVVPIPTKGALRAPAEAVAGTAVSVGYSVPAGVHLANYSAVWLYAPRQRVPGGAWEIERQAGRAYIDIKARSGSVALTLPAEPGRYELRLFDREGNDAILLDTASIEVRPKPPAR